MNKYLEKVAQLEKLAWDSDYNYNGEYGIAANRSVSNPMVHDMLSKAAKDPNMHVYVDEFSNKHNPKEFQKRMNEIKSKVGPSKSREQHKKDRTMQWHRDHSWSLSMKTDSPVVKSYIGKTNRWGDQIEDTDDAVLEHINTHYDK